MSAARRLLPGGRWCFQHGPIDLVIGAEGDEAAVAAAHEAAWRRFCPLLDELVAELPRLKLPVQAGDCPLRGAVARRMWAACAPLVEDADGFITPMAAVAGSVAEELIVVYRHEGIARAWVNNGGDIALHLAGGQSLRIGLFADLAALDPALARRAREGRLPVDGRFEIASTSLVRGVATSGWRGRSFSLGIADAVTVLAATAAQADAAATVIANAVDVTEATIVRARADSLRDDTDLGSRWVTVDVPKLASELVQQALAAGLACAQALHSRRLIQAAALVCQGCLARLPPATTVESRSENLVHDLLHSPQ